MLPETHDALLFSQLQEGLPHKLMESPAVSGAADYNALCLQPKTRSGAKLPCAVDRLTLSQSCRISHRVRTESPGSRHCPKHDHRSVSQTPASAMCVGSQDILPAIVAINEHLENSGQKANKPGHSNQTRTHHVQAEKDATKQHSSRDDPSDYLYSSKDSSEEVQVKQIIVQDEGSQPHCAHVQQWG